jgi:hypothetical protein
LTFFTFFGVIISFIVSFTFNLFSRKGN